VTASRHIYSKQLLCRSKLLSIRMITFAEWPFLHFHRQDRTENDKASDPKGQVRAGGVGGEGADPTAEVEVCTRTAGAL